jgi:uncharacterized protein YaaN involved in tellurite resistance
MSEFKKVPQEPIQHVDPVEDKELSLLFTEACKEDCNLIDTEKMDILRKDRAQSEYDYYRRVQMAEGKVEVLIEALKKAKTFLAAGYPESDERHPKHWLDQVLEKEASNGEKT